MVNKRKNVTETMDSDEEEGQDGEDDSPVPPQKRPRVSNDANDANDDVDEIDSQQFSRNGTGVSIEGIGAKVAALEADNERIERQEQRIRKRGARAFGSGASGTLKKIYLENFMCHERLSFDFGENMNFIIGHNGSGKSAILTGITLVLGGKTSSTGRAAGMGELVRSGATRGMVRVVLKNTGGSPFQPERWGDEITIERILVREGAGSSWRLKSSTNKVLSTKRQDVIAMMDHFDIQVDNPMTVLTQDMSRAFLSTSDPAKKYELFLRGTRLQKLMEEYSALDEQAKLIEADIERYKDGYEESVKEKDKWKKMIEKMDALNKQADKIDELAKDLAWATVIRQAEAVKDMAKRYEKAKAEFDAAQANLNDTTGGVDGADTAIKEAEQAKQAFMQGSEHVEDELRDVVQTVKDLTDTKSKQTRAIQDLGESVQDKETAIAKLEKQRDEEMRRTGRADFARQQEELKTKKKEAEARLAKITTQLPLTENKLKAAKENFDKTSASLKQLRADKDDVNSRATRVQENVNHLRRNQASGSTDMWNRYGQNIGAVWDEIRKASWHGGQPIGPLGMHVKVQKGQEQYIPVVQASMGLLLISWAVRDSKDRATLTKIFTYCQNNRNTRFVTGGRSGPPPIITHAGELFDYSQGDMRRHHPTVLSILEVSDQHVVRLLINGGNVERILVSEKRRQADEVAKSLISQMGSVQVWTADLFRVSTSKHGGLSSSVVSEWNGAPMLTTDLGPEIEARTRELEELEKQVEGIVQETRELESTRERHSAELTAQQESLTKLKQFREEARRDIQGIDHKLLAEEPVAVSTWTAEIERLKIARQEEDAQFLALNEQLSATTEQQAAAKTQRDELKKRRDEYTQQLNKHLEAIATAKSNKEQLNRGHADLVQKRDRKSQALEEKEAEHHHGEATLKQWRKDALDFAEEERYPTESIDNLKRMKRAAEQAKDAKQASFPHSFQQVTAFYNTAQAKWQKAEDELKGSRGLLTKIKDLNNRRRRNWVGLRQHTSVETQDAFSRYLSKRGFRGELILDHENLRLDMNVATEALGSRKETATTDRRALSGGESTFTTLCLILAIWHNVHSPLRCLDEFDVFMDAANRRLAMSMLVQVATGVNIANDNSLNAENALTQNGDNRQYILITPQEMSGATLPSTVKVLRMRDPERGGQTRLTSTTE